MKISTKTRYGLRFMIDLAQRGADARVSLKEVAESQGISKKYLEQVVAPLAAAGLVTVTRGNQGGYQLAHPAATITLAEVVNASEDGLALLDCTSELALCERADSCPSRQVWQGLEDAMRTYLEGQTLGDFADESTAC